MSQLYYNSGNQNKRMKPNNNPEFLENMYKWINEIEKKNLDNLDNYVTQSFTLLRDRRLYGSDTKYGIPSVDMNSLIEKIRETNALILRENYQLQLQKQENNAKFGAMMKGLSNGTFSGGVKHKNRTLKKSRRSRRGRRTRHSRHGKKRKTIYSRKKV
jgi:hypothetical protein